MESFIGLILLVAVVAMIIFYKGAIKKTGQYAEDVVTTNIAENQINLIRRSQEAYAKLEAEFGDDFITPDEFYNKLQKRKKMPVEQRTKK